jgi:putative effector of murein hydrolase
MANGVIFIILYSFFLLTYNYFVIMQIAKVLMIVVLGFLYSLSTVSFSVLFLRAAQGNIVKVAAPVPSIKKGAAAVPTVAARPYSEETLSFLVKGALVSGVISLLATRAGNDYITPLQTIFLGFATFASFVWSARLPPKFVKVVHPLITSTTLVWGILRLTGMATGASFSSVLRTYKVGSLDLMKAGAGDLMLFMLGPSVVSFSLAMYSRRKLLKDNFLIVITAMLVSSVGGLFGTAAFCRLIALGGSAGGLVRRSVLSRNVTTALAMAITAILGGDISIAASVVTLTGILGATYGRSLLDKMGISDPITRGLGVGAAAQGLGVSSLVVEPDAFPFAAMSMVLTAVSATVLVSIPAIKDALINLAGP